METQPATMNADANIPTSRKQKAVLNLLMLHRSQNEAEPLINSLRDAGQSTRSQFIASTDELAEKLAEQGSDVVCVHLDSEAVDARQAIELLRRQGRDLPIIGLTGDPSPATLQAAFAQGVEDVVADEFPAHFVHAVLRAHRNLLSRRRQRELELRLQESQRRCQLLLDESRDAIAYVHEGMHIYANQAYRELFGYDDMEELSCMPLVDLIRTDPPRQLKNELKKVGQGDKTRFRAQGEHESGEPFDATLDISPAAYEGEPCIQIVIRKSNVDAEALQAKVREMATYDTQTNLHNRAYFDERLQEIVAEAARQGTQHTLLFLQVANFNELKSELGIAGADIVLADVAEILRTAFSEARVIARFLDDVFTLICRQSLQDSENAVTGVIQRLTDHLFEVSGKTAQVQLHAGLISIDETHHDPTEAVTHAHEACMLAIKAGRPCRLWEPGAQTAADNTITAQLREALAADELSILFQPVMNLRRGSEENYEVLVRLHGTRDETLIEPQEFLDAADVADLSRDLDRWVFRRTVVELAEHRRSRSAATRAFIHLTAASVQDPTFLPWANKVLREQRLPGDAIVFQVSERVAHTYLKMLKAFVKGINVLHAGLAVIRFGHQQHNDTLFRHLKIDYIKVDPGFIRDLDQPANMERLSGILQQIHQHEVASIVPHIENAAVLGNLWPLGVHYVQGYYLQAPAQSMDFTFEEDD